VCSIRELAVCGSSGSIGTIQPTEDRTAPAAGAADAEPGCTLQAFYSGRQTSTI
jgi:hypothetical protein